MTHRKRQLVVCAILGVAGLLATAGTDYAQDARVSLGQPRTGAAFAQNEGRKVKFEFRDAKWDLVIEFVAKNLGLDYVGSYRPGGTFNFIPSGKRTDGLYTMSEVVDIINQALLKENYLLIRTPTPNLTIVLTEKPEEIDQSLIPRISLEDLEAEKTATERKLGKSELVQVEFKLKVLTPADADKEIRAAAAPVKFLRVLQVQRGNKILVTDTAENLRRIKKLLDDIDGPGDQEYERIPLGGVDGKAFSTIVTTTYPNLKPTPFLDETQNVLIVRGTKSQINEVKLLARAHGVDVKIDATGNGAAATSVPAGQVRHIKITKGTPAEVIETLMYMWPQLRANPIDYVTSSQLTDALNAASKRPPAAPIAPARPPVEEKPKARPMPPAEEDKVENSSEKLLNQGGGTQGPGGQLDDPQKRGPVVRGRQLPGDPSRPVFLAAGQGSTTNVLLVGSDDPDALVLIQELVDYLMKPGSTQFRVIPIQYGDATAVARLIDEAYNGRQQRGGGGFNPLQMLMGGRMGGGRGEGMGFNPFGGGGGEAPAAPGAAGATPAGTVRVVADTRTNSVLVRGPTLELETIQRLVHEYFDAEESNTPLPDANIIKLKHARAMNIYNVLTQVYRDYMSTGRGGNNNNTQMMAMVPFGLGGGGAVAGSNNNNNNSRLVSLSIAVDEINNSLIVSCPKPLFDQLKGVVDQLDLQSKPSMQSITVIPAKNVDPLLVDQLVRAMNPQGTPGMGAAGGGQFQGGQFAGGGMGNQFRGGQFGGGQFGGGQFGGGGTGNQFRGGQFGGGQFGGGGGNRFGGGGGFPTGGGGGGGRRGGGGGMRPDDGSLSEAEPRGPSFFADRVTDDPMLVHSTLFDPEQSARHDQPLTLAFHQEGQPGTQPPAGQPPAGGQPPAADDPSAESPNVPLQIVIDPITGQMIIIGPKDAAERLRRAIEELQKRTPAPEIKVVQLKRSDANSMATTLSSVVSVLAIPDQRTNSLILAGGAADMQLAQILITRLDGTSLRERINHVHTLKNTMAQDLVGPIQDFFSQQLQLVGNVQGGASERAVIVVAEPISNALIVSTPPQHFADVMAMIEHLDRQQAQVLIQVLIAEVTMNNVNEFGVELGWQSPVLFQRSVVVSGTTINTAAPGFDFTAPGAPLPNSTLAAPESIGVGAYNRLGVGQTSRASGPGGFVFNLSSQGLRVLVRALQEQNKIDVLSEPQIVALDNELAFIQVGQNVPIPTDTTIVDNNVVTGVDYEQTGVILRVTPHINADGSIVMRVQPTVSSVASTSIQISPGVFAPVFNITQAETTVVTMDGQTVVIGGLIRRSDDKAERKVPWLGDIPYLGAAFRFRAQTKQRTELLIIMTPQIIRSPCDPTFARILAEESAKMHWRLSDVYDLHGPFAEDVLMPGVDPRPSWMSPMRKPYVPQEHGPILAPEMLPPPQKLPSAPEVRRPTPPPATTHQPMSRSKQPGK